MLYSICFDCYNNIIKYYEQHYGDMPFTLYVNNEVFDTFKCDKCINNNSIIKYYKHNKGKFLNLKCINSIRRTIINIRLNYKDDNIKFNELRNDSDNYKAYISIDNHTIKYIIKDKNNTTIYLHKYKRIN